eukprot:c7826_g1_i1.p1 GENE.c7826_g1_i1~~c7826_g1_i1.p1  ORF type:complete len:1219 (-),score=310.28 c7826_g1_i1:21-3677(-)
MGKRSCNAPRMSKTVLDQFWGLASLDQKQRIRSCRLLISALKKSQESLTPGELSGDITYSLRRLVRGLSSSRDGARQGFSMALIELLKEFPFISADDVLSQVKESTTITKSIHGQEERDMLFGRLFGLSALFKAGRLRDASDAILRGVVTELQTLANKKSFLNEVAHSLLCDIVAEFPEASLPLLTEVLVSTFADTEIGKLSAERFALGLALEKRLGTSLYRKPLLHKSHFEEINPILLDSCQTHPRIHMLWKHILNDLSSSDKRFTALWPQLTDKLATSTVERRSLCLSLLVLFAPQLQSSQVGVVLPHPVVTMITKSALNASLPLHKVTRKVLSALIDAAKRDTSLAMPLVMQFASQTNPSHFTALTRTHGLRQLFALLKSEDVNKYMDFVCAQFVTVEDDDNAVDDEGQTVADTKRLWALEQLCNLARDTIHQSETPQTASIEIAHLNNMRRKIIKFMAVYAQCDVDVLRQLKKNDLAQFQSPSPALTQKVREGCAQRVLSLVLDLDNVKPQSGKEGEPSPERVGWIKEMVTLTQSIIAANIARPIMLTPLAPAALATRETCLKTLHKLEKLQAAPEKSKSLKLTQAQAASFERLLGFLIVMQTVQPTDNHDTLLDDVVKVFDNLGTEPHDSGISSIEVLTEILLSLLLDSSLVLRKIVSDVFNAFADRMTVSTMGLVSDVLTRSAKEEAQLFGLDGDDDEEDEEEDDHSHSDHSHSDESDDDDEDDDEDDEEDEEEEEDEPPKATATTTTTTSTAPKQKPSQDKVNGTAPPSDSNDDSDESEEDEGPQTEEEAAKYDKMLAGALSEIQEHKAKQKRIKQSILHFKSRVCSLLSDFVHHHPTSVLVLELIQPLLDAIGLCGDTKDKKELKVQLMFIVSYIFQCKKHPEYTPDVDSKLSTLLSTVFDLIHKTPSMVQVCTHGVIYLTSLAKSSASLQSESDNKLLEALKQFCTRRSCNIPLFLFSTIASRAPWLLTRNLQAVVDTFTSGRTDFIRCDAGSEVLSKLIPALAPDDHKGALALCRFGVAVLTALDESDTPKTKRTIQRAKAVVRMLADLLRFLHRHQALKAVAQTKPFVELKSMITEKLAQQQPQAIRTIFSNILNLVNNPDSSIGKKRKEAATGEVTLPKKAKQDDHNEKPSKSKKREAAVVEETPVEEDKSEKKKRKSQDESDSKAKQSKHQPEGDVDKKDKKKTKGDEASSQPSETATKGTKKRK